MKSSLLGVIVARFQVPDLSDGHRYLIESALHLHEKVLVVLGETESRLTQSAPMPYEMRRQMVLAAYPSVCVNCIMDSPDDTAWSNKLDHLISLYGSEAILYGSRASFLPHYVGQWRAIEVPAVLSLAGSQIRVLTSPRNNSDFRAGVVWASQWKFPISYQCVDMAVIDPRTGQLLCAMKRTDAGFRLPGGFVDPNDPTLEYAAKRELREETGIEPGDPEYIGSFRIADHRYRHAKDNILTALFAVPLLWGAPKAADDIEKVSWQPLTPATRRWMLPEYLPLFDAIVAWKERQSAQ